MLLTIKASVSTKESSDCTPYEHASRACLIYNTICGNFSINTDKKDLEENMCEMTFQQLERVLILLKDDIHNGKKACKLLAAVKKFYNSQPVINIKTLKYLVDGIEGLKIKIHADYGNLEKYEANQSLVSILLALHRIIHKKIIKYEVSFSLVINWQRKRFFELGLNPDILLEIILLEIRNNKNLTILLPEVKSFVLFFFINRYEMNKELYVEQMFRIIVIIYHFNFSLRFGCLEHLPCIQRFYSDFEYQQELIFRNLHDPPSRYLVKQYDDFINTLNASSIHDTLQFSVFFNNYQLVKTTFPFLIANDCDFLYRIFSNETFDVIESYNDDIYEIYKLLKRSINSLIQ